MFITIKEGDHWYAKDRTRIIVIRNRNDDGTWRFYIEWEKKDYTDDDRLFKVVHPTQYTFDITTEKLFEKYTVIPYYEMPEQVAS